MRDFVYDRANLFLPAPDMHEQTCVDPREMHPIAPRLSLAYVILYETHIEQFKAGARRMYQRITFPRANTVRFY